jgi:protease-4
MGSPGRKLTTEEKEILQNMIDSVYAEFVNAVVEGRDMSKNKVKKLADGRIYTGRKAKELGLVDKLGTFYDAVDEATKLAGIKGEAKLFYYNQPSTLERLLGSVNKLITYTLFDKNLNQGFNLKGIKSNKKDLELFYHQLLREKNNNIENLKLEY